MKKVVLVIISIITFGFSTELSGEVSGFLSVENSPYYVVSDLLVPENDSLIIEAGSIFYSNPNCWISTLPDAYIRAEGTETDSILFTDNPNDSIVAWGGINLENALDKQSIFRYCKIENAAPINGGNNYHGSGIVAIETNLIIDNSIIQNNKIKFFQSGGAGINVSLCKLILTNSIIKNNSFIGYPLPHTGVPSHGGGVWLWGAEPGSIFKNCIIAGNGPVGHGGGINISFGDNNVEFENNLIVDNSSLYTGGGISLLFGSTFYIKNSIIWNNYSITSLYGGLEIEINAHSQIFSHSGFNIESSIMSEDSCLFFNQTDPEGPGCDYTFYDFINTDPMFVDSENGDYRLLPQSPAINTGNGYPDPDGSPPDIGPIYFHLTKGDVNFDEVINLLDIVYCIQFIVENITPWNSQTWSMDMNEDEEINILDIIQVVNVILEG